MNWAEVSWKRAGTFLKSELVRFIQSARLMYSFSPVYRWASGTCRLIKKQQQNNKIRMWKSSMKNKMANNTSDLVAAGTKSNTKFKWSDDLVEDLLKALRNFKKVMEFHNKDFNADKPRQYKGYVKKLRKLMRVMWIF